MSVQQFFGQELGFVIRGRRAQMARKTGANSVEEWPGEFDITEIPITGLDSLALDPGNHIAICAAAVREENPFDWVALVKSRKRYAVLDAAAQPALPH